MAKMRTRLAGKAALGAAAALLAVALPSAGLAFGSLVGAEGDDNAPQTFLAFTPADADPRLAEFIARRNGDARMLRFTPAGAAESPVARSVTVAVRVDQKTANALAASSAIGAQRGTLAGAPGLRVTPTRFNLGLARGYSSFAQAPVRAIATPELSANLSNARIPDLSQFAPRKTRRDEPSRFAARIELEEDAKADDMAVSGETLTDQMLDVAGSYSLTRNLDITAGLRIEQDRDLISVPDLEKKDSQAVYIGTQFRF